MLRRCCFFVLSLCVCLSSFGQLDQKWKYYYPEFKNNAESGLYFRLENNNFVKNNEYFGEYTEGYTLMGYAVQPSVMYYAGSRLRVKAGLHLLKYSGVSEFTVVLPIFSVHAQLTDKLDLIMGGLKGDVHHRLIEPVFDTEYQYTRPVENGFQFVFQGDKLWLDSWLDWEQFIFPGDNKPEKFTAGISSEYRFTNAGSEFEVTMPVQLIATHLGGQISDFSESMQSLANIVSGIKLSKDVGDGFIQRVGVSTYFAMYKDLTKQSGWDFHTGDAVYPVAEVDYKYGSFMVGYWHARNFLAPKGSHVFQSVSDYKEGYYSKYRNLLTTKFSFTKTFMKQIKFSAMVETYYDVPASQFEYSYGINLVFTPNFFISKISFD
ncbi:MAG: hypothetical protein JEZ14_05195 [Marinilabiliaceae bacterium]|nr:hypothetical protein [Marinilabiliaceae bacterium]